MLESVKISRRQSEIRQTLAGLVGKATPADDETRQMESLDAEYRQNETRYRAALISEDRDRKEAKDDLETRGDKEWSDLIGRFEIRQVALALDEGRALDGATAEVVQELRQHGGYRGLPVPWLALERRAGETIASDTPDPLTTRPIIDRLFPDSAAARMGAQMITIDHGEVEYPVATSQVTAGWATSETGSVGGPTQYVTTDRPLTPDHTLGVQMRITRKTVKQSGDALEQAVRRDMNGAIAQEMDRAVFLGGGSAGEPTGIIYGADDFGITTTPINATASWSAFRGAVVRFIANSAASFVASPKAGQGSVRALIHPQVYDAMDGQRISGTAVTEFEKLAIHLGSHNVVMSATALLVEDSPAVTAAVLTAIANGVPPIFVGTWGAVDLIRDPFSDAASGGLRLTGLATLDVTISRAQQIEILAASNYRDAMLFGFHAGALELRRAGGETRLHGKFPYGVAAILSEIGGRPRKERFAARAFASRVEAPGDDIHLLVAHSFDQPLASKRTGTLTLRDTDAALVFDAEIVDAVANTTHGRDALALVGAGLAVGVSPGFRISSHQGAETIEEHDGAVLRTVKRAELFEISIVTMPAYDQAQVERRHWNPGIRSDATLRRALSRWRP